MTTKPRPAAEGTRPIPAGMRVVCGIDASRADPVAVHEACRVAGRHGHVALVCVIHQGGVGHIAQATIGPARAADALQRAMRQTREAGVRSSAYLVRHPHAPETLLRAALDGDVLVIGTHGVALGLACTTALHRAEAPVLVARPSIREDDDSILLAADGSDASQRAALLAGMIARRTDAPITVVNVGDEGDGEGGRAADAIIEAATACGSSLVVVGSHGRTGLGSLGTVSEKVARQAPCSVLVARPRRAV